MNKLGELKILSLETGRCTGCSSRFRKIDLENDSYHLGLCLDCQQMLDVLIGDDIEILESIGG